MTKKLAAQIDAHLNALESIEHEQANAYLAADKRTREAKTALAIAKQARNLQASLMNVWKHTSKELSKLARKPEFAPIHEVLLEVIAAKAAAGRKRRVERAQQEARAFSLEARARIHNV